MRWKLAVILLAIVCVSLAAQVRNLRPLREEVQTFRRWRTYPYPRQVVSTVRATTLTGDTVTIGETARGRTQVLIVFTTTCPYCRENLPAWKQLTAELLADSAKRHDVYWVSLSQLDSTLLYVAEHGLAAPVVLPPDTKMMRVYRIRAVPMTLVLDHTGRVIHARPSVLTSRIAIDSVLAAARVVDTLPMLPTSSSDTASLPPP